MPSQLATVSWPTATSLSPAGPLQLESAWYQLTFGPCIDIKPGFFNPNQPLCVAETGYLAVKAGP